MSRERLADTFLLLAIFFLPWQTRWIFGESMIHGQVFEYGKMSLYATEVLVVAAALFRGRFQWSETGKKFAVSAFAVLVVVTVLVVGSLDVRLTLNALLHLSVAFLFFLLILDQRTPVIPVVISATASLFIPVFLGWFQVLSGWSPASTWFGLAVRDTTTLGDAVVETQIGRMLRAYGSFPHPNIFGGAIVIGIFLLAWLARAWRFTRARWFVWSGTFVLASTLTITFSRSAYLALGIGAIVLIAQLLWRQRAPPRKALPLLLVGGFALLLTIVIFHEPMFARFNPSLRLEAKSIEERGTGYRDAWQIFSSHPLVGTGVGAYTRALSLARPGNPVWSYQPVHNTFVLVLCELGLLGVIVVGWFLRPCTMRIWSVRKTPTGMFTIAFVAVLAILAFFDHYLWTNWSGLAFLALTFGLFVRWNEPFPSS